MTHDETARFQDLMMGNISDPKVQYKLGLCYYKGYGTSVDKAKAAEWFGKAAEQGLAAAQYCLGECYYDGIWSERTSAASGQRSLDDNGTDIPADAAKAAEWYRKAADQGDARAQYRMGLCCLTGYGVPENEAKAAEWFRKAARQGHAKAQGILHSSFEKDTNMLKETALKRLQKAAGEGDAEAQFNLGLRYFDSSAQQDRTKAVEWFQKAAEGGHALAQFIMGQYCEAGIFMPEDQTLAIEWHKKAADQGIAGAQYRMGEYCRCGIGMPVDKTKAAEWYRKAAEQGYADAQYMLGKCYEKGTGVPLDKFQAREWYYKAADAGSKETLGLTLWEPKG